MPNVVKNEINITLTLMAIIFLSSLAIAILSVLGMNLGIITVLAWIIVVISIAYFIYRISNG